MEQRGFSKFPHFLRRESVAFGSEAVEDQPRSQWLSLISLHFSFLNSKSIFSGFYSVVIYRLNYGLEAWIGRVCWVPPFCLRL